MEDFRDPMSNKKRNMERKDIGGYITMLLFPKSLKCSCSNHKKTYSEQLLAQAQTISFVDINDWRNRKLWDILCLLHGWQRHRFFDFVWANFYVNSTWNAYILFYVVYLEDIIRCSIKRATFRVNAAIKINRGILNVNDKIETDFNIFIDHHCCDHNLVACGVIVTFIIMFLT